MIPYTLKTPNGDLYFEDGKLIKFNGMRIQYLDGHQMIHLIRQLSVHLYTANYQLTEVAGVAEEYLNIPCSSLRQSLNQAVTRAQPHILETTL